MRYDEYINEGTHEDFEAYYDGWFGMHDGMYYDRDLLDGYQHTVIGNFIGRNSSHNYFEEFELFSIMLHYDFPYITLLDDYISGSNKMLFYCENCNKKFEKRGELVLQTGCPYCCKKRYKGEELLYKILEKNNLLYTTHDSYGCVNPKTGYDLPYDAIVEYEGEVYFIEVQGYQHQGVVEFFGGEKGFEERQYRDSVKKEYAIRNGVFIELDYKESNLDLLEERIYEQLGFMLKECK